MAVTRPSPASATPLPVGDPAPGAARHAAARRASLPGKPWCRGRCPSLAGRSYRTAGCRATGVGRVSVAVPTSGRFRSHRGPAIACPKRRPRPPGCPELGRSVGTRCWTGCSRMGVGAEDDLHQGALRPDPDDESTVIHAITCLSVLSCSAKRAGRLAGPAHAPHRSHRSRQRPRFRPAAPPRRPRVPICSLTALAPTQFPNNPWNSAL
jgi:hypothetical protein